MSDIVKRLNAAPVANHYYRPGDHINGTVLTERREAATEITRLRTENERLRGALNEIAQWYDGDVGPHMDEPASAGTARAALKENSDD